MLDEAAELGLPLTGGRMTPGVVRVGETVRRPVSPFAVLLLSHLASAGFDGAAEVVAWTRQEAAHFGSCRSTFAAALAR